MRIALVFLAACWSGYVEPRAPSQPRPVERKLVQCWSPEFHAQWPEEAALYELIAKCDAMWPDDQVVSDSCVYMEMWRAYQELLTWTTHWFEACS